MEKIKVLLDTDIGNDIDDAVALAYLLRQPRCELVGITTVTGRPVERAMLASVICTAAGEHNIPIYPGCEMPLMQFQQQSQVPQAAVLDRFPHKTNFPMRQHISFMIDTIRSNPGEVTLLCIGPLTNIALLFATDPEIPMLIKDLVMMCGDFTKPSEPQPKPEWNAKLDTVATAMVYRSLVKNSRTFGLNTTKRVKMTAGEVRRAFQTDILKTILPMAEVWFEKWDFTSFHDPLAAVSIFDNALCTFERGDISVELFEEGAAGTTLWQPDAQDGRHLVAFDVDENRFFKSYFSVF